MNNQDSAQVEWVPVRITAYDLEVMQNPELTIVHVFPPGVLEHAINTITEATAYCGHSWIPRESHKRKNRLERHEAMCDECSLYRNQRTED